MKRLFLASGLALLGAACSVEEPAPAAAPRAPEPYVSPQSVLAYEPIYDARGVYSVVSMDSVSAYAQEPPSAPAPLS